MVDWKPPYFEIRARLLNSLWRVSGHRVRSRIALSYAIMNAFVREMSKLASPKFYSEAYARYMTNYAKKYIHTGSGAPIVHAMVRLTAVPAAVVDALSKHGLRDRLVHEGDLPCEAQAGGAGEGHGSDGLRAPLGPFQSLWNDENWRGGPSKSPTPKHLPCYITRDFSRSFLRFPIPPSRPVHRPRQLQPRSKNLSIHFPLKRKSEGCCGGCSSWKVCPVYTIGHARGKAKARPTSGIVRGYPVASKLWRLLGAAGFPSCTCPCRSQAALSSVQPLHPLERRHLNSPSNACALHCMALFLHPRNIQNKTTDPPKPPEPSPSL
eukprot:scaffold47_cov258-Pinguiococcus_pyrenoidosus.AAC.121